MKRPPAPPVGGSLDADPAFFRSLVESSSEATAVLDPVGRIVYANPAAQRLLGMGTADGARRSFFAFIHPEDAIRVRGVLEAAATDPEFRDSSEIRVARPDGRYLWMRSSARWLAGGPAAGDLLIQLHDVTPRREAEARRREAELHLRRVVDQLPIVLFGMDADGVLTLAEGRGMTDLGLAPEDVIGRNVFEMFAENPENIASLRKAMRGQIERSRAEAEGRVWDTQYTPVRDAHGVVQGLLGVTLDVTEAARQEQAAAFHALLLDNVGQAVVATDPDGQVMYWNRGAERLFGWTADEALGRDVREMVPEGVEQDDPGSLLALVRQGESWSGDYAVRNREGEVIPVLMSNQPVVEKGEVVAVIGVLSDLREMKRLEEQLRRAQKMEAVGQLAGGVAHDFNNLLTTIGGYAGMAAERARDPQLTSDIAEIVRATERGRGLVDKLLAFVSRDRVSLHAVDVNECVRELVSTTRRSLGPGVGLEMDLAEDLWPVRSDAVRLSHALMNVVMNASEAMPEGGTVTIRTDNVTLTAAAAARLEPRISEGDYVRAIVADSGVGMDAAVLARMFEPFFTTRPVGKGTGLGLSTVFGVVRSLGGGIQVESEPGEGTRFFMYLPRAAAGGVEAEGPLRDPIPRAARILLVEDEPAVRNLARRVLERDGHRVIEAENGVQALARVEEGVQPDLLVTDVIMPEMGGGELVRRLESLRPGLRVLYMSGYTADELEDRGVEASSAFLPKPFSPALLLARVREVLDAPPPPPPPPGDGPA